MSARAVVILAMLAALPGCYAMRESAGSGDTAFAPPRTIVPADIALPPGYRIEAVATGLTFPTGVAFDDRGRPHVIEAGYSYGEKWTTPRLLRIEPGGGRTVLAEGGRNGPWTGVSWRDGSFYIAEGGELEGGAVLRVADDGKVTRLIDKLPSLGDHHVNGALAGPDGWVYFGIGTATNSGVVGQDNADMGWLRRHPDFHDIPCRDVALAGLNFTAANPLKPGEIATTGAFAPLGAATAAEQVVPGRVPCSGAILRVRARGGAPELVAWGFRNPFGLAFAPDGRLFVTDNSYDERGSRHVFGAGDLLHEVRPGLWYGWPDYHGAERLDRGDRYVPPGHPAPQPLLAAIPNPPPKPAAVLGVHASADGFDFARNPAFGHVGQAFVAEFGDQAPATGKVWSPVGAKVVRVDPATGVVEDFAVNRGAVNGPASWLGAGGLERPVAARFDPAGEALYVVDFGVLTVQGKEFDARPETGVLWRITRQ